MLFEGDGDDRVEEGAVTKMLVRAVTRGRCRRCDGRYERGSTVVREATGVFSHRDCYDDDVQPAPRGQS